MTRTEVYQLRLTTDEKVALVRMAKDRNLSVAQMIRTDYGLAKAEAQEVGYTAPEYGYEAPEYTEAPAEPEPHHAPEEASPEPLRSIASARERLGL
jgi:hypothetical protein